MRAAGPRAIVSLALVATGCGQSTHPAPAPGAELSCASQLLQGAVSVVWSPEADLVSQQALGASAPALAVDTTGTLYVAYRDDMPSGRGTVTLRSKREGAVSFSAALVVSEAKKDARSPALAARSGLLALVWVETGTSGSRVVSRVSTDDGVSFAAPTEVSSSANESSAPRVAIDATGSVLVLWEGPEDAVGARPLSLSTSKDGGASFDPPLLVSTIQGLGEPVLAVAGARAFVAWAEIATTEGGHVIELTHSDGPGAPFEDPVRVAGETSSGPALLAEDEERLLLLWTRGTTTTGHLEELGVALSESSDGGLSFEAPTTLDGARGTNFHLAQSGDGGIWAAWSSCPSDACTTSLVRVDNGAAAGTSPNLVGPPGTPGATFELAALGAAGKPTVLWSASNGFLSDVAWQTFEQENLTGVSAEPQLLTPYGDTPPAGIAADARNPVLVASGATLLVAWAGVANRLPSPQAGIYVARSTNGGSTFDAPVRLADDAPTYPFKCRQQEPDAPRAEGVTTLAAAAHGSEVALAWSDEVLDDSWTGACYLATEPDIFLIRSHDAGASFDAPINVSGTASPSERPALAFDAHGALLVAWEEQVSSELATCSYTARRQILFRRDEGGELTPPRSLSELAHPGYCGNATSPVLASADASLFAAWLQQSAAGNGSRAIVSLRTLDGGSTLVASSQLDFPYSSEPLTELTGAATSESTLWLGVRQGAALGLTRSDDGAATLAPLVVIGSSTATSALALAAFDADQVWAAFSAREGREPGDIALGGLGAAGLAAMPLNVSANEGDSDAPFVLGVPTQAAALVWEDATPSPAARSVVMGCRGEP